MKLLDYAKDWSTLEANRNPFATVVMAHLKARETRDDVLSRKDWKLRLTRRLYEQGYGRNDPGLFDLLCDRTLNDPFERKNDWDDNPRQIALKFLVQHYPDHPKTRELLQDRAQNDTDKILRDWAAQRLAKSGWGVI